MFGCGRAFYRRPLPKGLEPLPERNEPPKMDLVDYLSKAIFEKDVGNLSDSIGAFTESQKTKGHEGALSALPVSFLEFLNPFRKSVDLFFQFSDFIL